MPWIINCGGKLYETNHWRRQLFLPAVQPKFYIKMLSKLN